MRYLTRTMMLTVAVILTLVSGVIHGRLSNRWGVPAEITTAAERLEAMPGEFGDWKLLESKPLSTTAIEMLQCAGYVNRVYVHQESGEMVMVAVLLGPPGPIAVHTPEICYSSKNYTIEEPRHDVAIEGDDASEHHVWAMTFRTTDVDANILRVCYAWSDGTVWQAASQPRVSYAGRPLLYKLQLACHVSPSIDLEKRDPGREFLRDFLPAVQEHLVSATDAAL